MGDYTNLSIDLDLNLNKIPGVCFPLDAIPPLGELPPLGRALPGRPGRRPGVHRRPEHQLRRRSSASPGCSRTCTEHRATRRSATLIPAACRNGHLLGGLDDLVDDLLGGSPAAC